MGLKAVEGKICGCSQEEDAEGGGARLNTPPLLFEGLNKGHYLQSLCWNLGPAFAHFLRICQVSCNQTMGLSVCT